MKRKLGPEAAKGCARRKREGFFEKFLSGSNILDIGYKGGDPDAEPITETAVGVDLDFPSYDGRRLPFADESQDAVFASHCLEHIEEYQMVLAEWYRVLKSGGYMIVAVPHRDLYERKANLPSFFNGSHKRFYTPATLLDEIEVSLPPGGYRVRSLRDIDDGFDYSIPPKVHAKGCYEIELVLQKIAKPPYADSLRPKLFASKLIELYAALLSEIIASERRGASTKSKRLSMLLSKLPIPPFDALKKTLLCAGRSIDEQALRIALSPLIAEAPFDEQSYLLRYKDVCNAVRNKTLPSAHSHFVLSGYFEGRLGFPETDDDNDYPALEVLR
jgi:SAM-dependent methyltransferase